MDPNTLARFVVKTMDTGIRRYTRGLDDAQTADYANDTYYELTRILIEEPLPLYEDDEFDELEDYGIDDVLTRYEEGFGELPGL